MNLVSLSWYIFTKLTEVPWHLMQLSVSLQKDIRIEVIEISEPGLRYFTGIYQMLNTGLHYIYFHFILFFFFLSSDFLHHKY